MRPRAGLAIEHPLEKRAVSILAAIFIVLVCAYVYFVASSIVNVMVRADALAEIRDTESSIGALEQQYLAISEDVTPQKAQALGLAPVQNTAYVYRPGNSAEANSDRHEI